MSGGAPALGIGDTSQRLGLVAVVCVCPPVPERLSSPDSGVVATRGSVYEQ